MLNLFLKNRAFTIIIIPVLLLVFWVGAFFQVLPENTNPTFVYALFYKSLAAYPFFNRILGLFAAIFLSYFISRVYNVNDFFNKENTVPSIVLVVMLGAWSGFHFFSPIFISLGFLLLAINFVLRIYHQKIVLQELFNASFLIGLSALFYYPLVLFVFSIYGFLFISRSFNLREFVMPLFGLSLPFYFLGIAFFLFDIPPDFFNYFDSGEIKSLLFDSGLTQRFYLVITLILLFLSLFYLFKIIGSSKVQVQLSRKFLLIFFVNGILVYLVSANFFPITEGALILVLPSALILPFFFYESKPLIKNLGFYFWLIAALLFDYIAI
jgi:hypothetical protein